MEAFNDLAGATARLARTPVETPSFGFLEQAMIAVAALIVLYLEVIRRVPDFNVLSYVNVRNYKNLLRQHRCEALCLVACLSLAVVLRVAAPPRITGDVKSWERSCKSWPILLTPDSLLAFQTFLRSLGFMSVVLRGSPSPLSNEAALCFLVAAIGRTVIASQSDVYMLDGPLGGYLPVGNEFLSVALLTFLSRGISKRGFLMVVPMVALASYLAKQNSLSISQDATIDEWFMFAHVSELFGAFAYLCRSVVMGSGSAVKQISSLGFTYAIMIMQQCLAAYFFAQAFMPSPKAVRAGHPFEILHFGAMAQLGAFAAAAALRMAE